MPTGDELISSIEPGTVPHGERQTLEAGLSQVAAAGAAPRGGGQPAAPAAGTPHGGDPLTALLGGTGLNDAPITEGMAAGPGAGPAPDISSVPPGIGDRLRLLAASARSPAVRFQARQALRRLIRQGP